MMSRHDYWHFQKTEGGEIGNLMSLYGLSLLAFLERLKKVTNHANSLSLCGVTVKALVDKSIAVQLICFS